MAEPSTRPTGASVPDLLDVVVPVVRRADGLRLAPLFRDVTGADAVMWGLSIVGYGTCRCVSPSDPRRTGQWPRTGFSPWKARLSLDAPKDLPEGAALVPELGAASEGAGCVHVRRLDDVDLGVLRRLVAIARARPDDAASGGDHGRHEHRERGRGRARRDHRLRPWCGVVRSRAVDRRGDHEGREQVPGHAGPQGEDDRERVGQRAQDRAPGEDGGDDHRPRGDHSDQLHERQRRQGGRERRRPAEEARGDGMEAGGGEGTGDEERGDAARDARPSAGDREGDERERQQDHPEPVALGGVADRLPGVVGVRVVEEVVLDPAVRPGPGAARGDPALQRGVELQQRGRREESGRDEAPAGGDPRAGRRGARAAGRDGRRWIRDDRVIEVRHAPGLPQRRAARANGGRSSSPLGEFAVVQRRGVAALAAWSQRGRRPTYAVRVPRRPRPGILARACGPSSSRSASRAARSSASKRSADRSRTRVSHARA